MVFYFSSELFFYWTWFNWFGDWHTDSNQLHLSHLGPYSQKQITLSECSAIWFIDLIYFQSNIDYIHLLLILYGKWVLYDNAYSLLKTKCLWVFKPTKDIQNLKMLTGKLWNIFCDFLEEKWPLNIVMFPSAIWLIKWIMNEWISFRYLPSENFLRHCPYHPR